MKCSLRNVTVFLGWAIVDSARDVAVAVLLGTNDKGCSELEAMLTRKEGGMNGLDMDS